MVIDEIVGDESLAIIGNISEENESNTQRTINYFPILSATI